MTNQKGKDKMIMKKSYAFTLTISTFVIGIFQILNDDYLAKYGLERWPHNMQWVDDNFTGLMFVVFAIMFLSALVTKNVNMQQVCVVILGSIYFSLGSIYAFRSFNGYENITWILLFTLFFILIFSLRTKGDRLLYERLARE